MHLDAITDELYSSPPQEYTATGGTREKEARAAGDRKLTAAFHLLAQTHYGGVAGQPVRA